MSGGVLCAVCLEPHAAGHICPGVPATSTLSEPGKADALARLEAALTTAEWGASESARLAAEGNERAKKLEAENVRLREALRALLFIVEDEPEAEAWHEVREARAALEPGETP